LGRVGSAVNSPKPGREQQLPAVVDRHPEVLRAAALVTARPAGVTCAGNGALVEVLGWRLAAAVAAAHKHPAARALEAEFAAACDDTPLAALAEPTHPLAKLDAVNP
jgi:hypothetical protein